MLHAPFVVLDMNVCRKAGVVQPLLEAFDQTGVEVCIPAVANWEMTKGSGQDTVTASLQLLSRRPEAVRMAWHSRVIKDREKKFKSRIDVTDLRQTSNVRDVLRCLRDGTHVVDPASVASMRAFWGEHLDADDDANVIRQFEGAFRQQTTQDDANRIRKALLADPVDRRPFQAQLGESIGGRADLARFLQGVGYGQVTARKLAAVPSVSLLYIIALGALTLRLRIMGGIDTTKVQSLHNHMCDVEYAVLGVFGSGLMTEDHGARAVYEDTFAVALTLWG